MHPRLWAENGRHTVIRPLIYVWEAEILEHVPARGFPVVLPLLDVAVSVLAHAESAEAAKG